MTVFEEQRIIYEKQKRQTDSIYKIACNLRNRTQQAFNSQNVKKFKKTFGLTGCSPSFLKKWFIHLFSGNMFLENYGILCSVYRFYPLSITKSLTKKRCTNVNIGSIYDQCIVKKINQKRPQLTKGYTYCRKLKLNIFSN